RHDDLVWRVRFGDQWLYVYLLLEFQATEDRFMALRIMVYLGLLYQDLVKSKQLTENDRLPPVLPLVLYNGESRWSAPIDIVDLVEKVPGSLGRYAPRLSYLLLDEGAFSSEELGALKNFVAALFKLEKSQSEENLLQVVTNLLKWLEEPKQASLRRAFTVWFNRVLVPRKSKQPTFEKLEEVGTMLSERVREWNKKWIDEGLA
ncbi:MAG: Rpn family recombination-promoting nuclease/putative transposase, partial [Proteobacteria bacterium]|nr:Rpn family recombination-promoting nuclease/putative transposase [Pseudomonadota bacterium]